MDEKDENRRKYFDFHNLLYRSQVRNVRMAMKTASVTVRPVCKNWIFPMLVTR